MTALDFVGVYDPLTRLNSMGYMQEFRWDICSVTSKVVDDRGLQFMPDKISTSLANYDLVILPGGFGTRTLKDDSRFIDWLRSAESAERLVSVCTGSLLLGAAGFLSDKMATTHPSAFQELQPYCRRVSEKRICDEGQIITAGGVSAAIDLGLYLVESLTDINTRTEIARQMDYPYEK